MNRWTHRASGLLVAALALPLVAAPQDPGGVVVEYEDGYGGGEAAPRKARDQASDFLNGKRWTEGWDRAKGIYTAIGVAAINAPAGSPNFDAARRQAATMSLMNAKASLARFLAAEVEASIDSKYSEPNIGATLDMSTEMPSEPGIIDKVVILVNDELDSMLQERDIDPGDPDGARAAAAAAKQMVASETFSSAVSVMARQEIGGVQAYRTFESIDGGTGNQIACIAIFSPKSAKLHDALLGAGDPPSGSPRENLAAWARSQGAEELLYTHGVQPRTDESGEVCLVMFGQSSPRTSSSRSAQAATTKARNNALAEARRFLGEMVVIAESQDESSSYAEYADESSMYASNDSLEEEIRSRAAKLSMPGISQIHTWEFKHPLSNKTTYGWVGKMSVTDALDANQLRDVFNEVAGSKGGKGISNRRPKKTPRPSDPASGGGGTGGGAGVEGEDP
jgi:hypothetical protein